MLSTLSAKTISAALLFETVSASYVQQEDWSGNNFFNNFWYFDYTSPTGGPDYTADYVDKSTAENNGLTYVKSNGNVRIDVNTQGVVSDQREAIRLQSNRQFENDLVIIDLDHIPAACGTWPAWWFVGAGGNWPYNGEIDVIEKVNFDRNGRYTLHTDENCYTSGFDQSVMTGTVQETPGTTGGGWCNSINGHNDNSGCGIGSDIEDFGIGFNEQGGGVVAVEMFLTKEPKWIKIWSFPRDEGIPSDIESGNPDPLSWGKPRAWFPLEDNCKTSMSHAQIMVINTELCGEWAGNALPQQCADQYNVARNPWGCKELVKNNPEALKDAYWEIRSIKSYGYNGDYTAQPNFVPNPNSPNAPVTGDKVCAPTSPNDLSGAITWAINDSGLDVLSGMPAECTSNDEAKATYVFGKYYEQAKNNHGDCNFNGKAALQDPASLNFPGCAYPAAQFCVPKSGASAAALWDAWGFIGTQGVDNNQAPSGCDSIEQKATYAMSAYYALKGSCSFSLDTCQDCGELTTSPSEAQCLYKSASLGATDETDGPKGGKGGKGAKGGKGGKGSPKEPKAPKEPKEPKEPKGPKNTPKRAKGDGRRL